MDDLSGGSGTVFALGDFDGWTVYRYGQAEPVAAFPGVWSFVWDHPFARAGNLAYGGTGRVYDTRNWQPLIPPPGRKFHPDLARFAPDGRFVVVAAGNIDQVVIDTQTEKSLPMEPYTRWHHLPGGGMIAAKTSAPPGTIRLLPPAARLDIPADLLELWRRSPSAARSARMVGSSHLTKRPGSGSGRNSPRSLLLIPTFRSPATSPRTNCTGCGRSMRVRARPTNRASPSSSSTALRRPATRPRRYDGRRF